MKLSIISFTERGRQLSERMGKILEKDISRGTGADRELEVCLYTKCRACMDEEAHSSPIFVKTSIGEWAKEQMQERNALLFIGACGIAVRAIAPSLTDKLHDAPALVMDEKGKYIIPILSGHMGGANEIAGYIAKITGAEPVITTATDINQKFAVDLFAKRNGLSIVNKDGIVKVSSKILAGKEVTMSIEPGHLEIGEEKEGRPENCLPEGIRLAPYPPEGQVDIVVTSEDKAFDSAILLRPKEYIIGMGCKKGKSIDEIDGFIKKKIGGLGICAAQIFALASISQKKDEQGMVAWCKKEGVRFFTYTGEELQNVKGNFEESSFVKAQVGVGNVCERAALKACEETGAILQAPLGADKAWKGRGNLIASKHAENGMTIAVAKREWRVFFYGE